MVNFAMSCPIGLGDIIFTHNILENEKHRFEQIIINPKWDIVYDYKNGLQGYSDFIFALMKNVLFTDSKYFINIGGNYKYLTIMDLVHDYKFKISKPNLKSIFKYGDSGIKNPYVVVFTKVRDLDIWYWQKIKEKFFEYLKDISKTHQVVIVGERQVEMNSEYVSFGNGRVYSLYNDLISSGISIVDYTIPKLGLTVPNFEIIKRDCSIMGSADCVFTVGIGGGFVLASGSSKKMIAFCHDDYDMMSYAFRDEEGVCIRLNEESFLLEVNKFKEMCVLRTV